MLRCLLLTLVTSYYTRTYDQTQLNVDESTGSAFTGTGLTGCSQVKLCGTPENSLCPAKFRDRYQGITLHCENQVRRLRALDFVPYLTSLLLPTLPNEDELCACKLEQDMTYRYLRFEHRNAYELFEIDPADAVKPYEYLNDYVFHLITNDLTFLPRLYFIFTSSKCRNKIFGVKNIQFPPEYKTRIWTITGLTRTGEDWIKLDKWATDQMSIDVQAPKMLEPKDQSQYEIIRNTILNDLKNYVTKRANGTLINYDLSVSVSEWDIPLCDSTGKTGNTCQLGLEVERHNMWPPGFIGDDPNKTKSDFIRWDHTLHLETSYLSDEQWDFFRHKTCDWVKDDLRDHSRDYKRNNCFASVQPKGMKTTVTYDMVNEKPESDLVIWDISTALDADTRSSFNFSSYFIDVPTISTLTQLPEAGIYRVHSIKKDSEPWKKGVRENWRVTQIDGIDLLNAKYDVSANINHPFDFNRIRSIKPAKKSPQGPMTITFENPEMVSDPESLTTKLYCFALENVLYNSKKYDPSNLPSYCHNLWCTKIRPNGPICQKCHENALANYITGLTKSFAQAIPSHYDNLLAPKKLLPTEKECKRMWSHAVLRPAMIALALVTAMTL